MIIHSNLYLPFSRQQLKNRIVKAALTECLCDAATNSPSPQLLHLYEVWAKRTNASMLITGNIMVDRRYLEAPNNFAIEDERDLDAMKQWVERVHKNNPSTKLLAQLSHPGRQSPKSVTSQPLAPSEGVPAVKMILPLFHKPRALTPQEIQEIKQRFIKAAMICHKAGWDGVEIHSAHGYLLSQFLSPKTNQRTDQYGGSEQNRRRFLIEIIQGIRQSIPEESKFILGVKINSADFQKGGFSEEESMHVILALAQINLLDFIEVSGGTYENAQMIASVHKNKQKNNYNQLRQSTLERELFFYKFVRETRSLLNQNNQKIPLMLTGGFRKQSMMESTLQSGEVDLIGLGRPFCLEPDKIANLADPSYSGPEIEFISPKINFQWDFMRHVDPGIENLWHQQQMWRLASNLEPDFTMGRIWILTIGMMKNYLWHPKRTTFVGWANITIVTLLLFYLIYKLMTCW